MPQTISEGPPKRLLSPATFPRKRIPSSFIESDRESTAHIKVYEPCSPGEARGAGLPLPFIKFNKESIANIKKILSLPEGKAEWKPGGCENKGSYLLHKIEWKN